VTQPPPRTPRYGRLFWTLLPVGALLIAWGVLGLLRQAASTAPASWLAWFLGGLLVHDLLLAPAVFAVGLATRRLPTPLRPPVRAALIVSGTLALTSVPLLLGYGRTTQPGNSSLLPGDYPANLITVLAAIWIIAAAWALYSRVCRRRRPPPARRTATCSDDERCPGCDDHPQPAGGDGQRTRPEQPGGHCRG
jgi:hypothetical protein